jgi:hypothetical protein
MRLGLLFLVGLVTALVACESGGDGVNAPAAPPSTTSPPPTPTAPGAQHLTDEAACSTDADCTNGEACDHGICQIRRCATTYTSAPPLGVRHVFEAARELIVVDGMDVRSFGAGAGSALGNVGAGGVTVTDAAGGDLFGARPEAVALAVRGHKGLDVVGGPSRVALALSFEPVAVGAGDTDDDGVDEIVALGAKGELAVCRAAAGKCDELTIANVTGLDVTLADVDADGAAEPVLLLKDTAGKTLLYVWNRDHAATGQDEVIAVELAASPTKLGVFVPGTGPAQVLALEDGGYLGLASDTVYAYAVADKTVTVAFSGKVAKDAVDVHGDAGRVLVLTAKGTLEAYAADKGAMTLASTTTLSGASAPTRLTMADTNGDSPVGVLTGAPEVVAGELVPTAVVLYPPYSYGKMEGASQIVIGNAASTSNAAQDSVGLRTSVALGFEAEFPGIAKASVTGKVEQRLDRSHTITHYVTVSDRFTVDARPDLAGKDNAVVVLSNGCFHAYSYVVDDPKGKLGANGKKMVVFVPVGGQTSVWSLKRYDAFVAATKTGTAIHVPYEVSDPSTYPRVATTLHGAPAAEADVVVRASHAYHTSDVARVGWQVAVGASEANSVSTSTTATAIGAVEVGGVSVQTEVGGSYGASYTVTLGKEASFGGSVPPLKPGVTDGGFSFSPLVYREPGTGGYFVVTYAVGD